MRGTRSFRGTGELRTSSGHVDRYGFTGQRRDPSSGLIHFRFRELHAATGRWVSPDPLFLRSTPRGLSRLGEATTGYAYVAGNWVNAVDPNGLHAVRPRRPSFLRRVGPVRGAPELIATDAVPDVANQDAAGLELMIANDLVMAAALQAFEDPGPQQHPLPERVRVHRENRARRAAEQRRRRAAEQRRRRADDAPPPTPAPTPVGGLSPEASDDESPGPVVTKNRYEAFSDSDSSGGAP